tara:strand:- start:1367 stop:1555 length:189 start_codon:yes stop_codon:yes gene_type:complete
MNLFWLRRRLRSEIQGLKYVLGNEKSKEIIKLSYVAYQVSRVIYNPYYLLDLSKGYIFKNLI